MMADMKGLSKTKNAQDSQTCGLENLIQITTLNSHPVMLYRILVFVINQHNFPMDWTNIFNIHGHCGRSVMGTEQ